MMYNTVQCFTALYNAVQNCTVLYKIVQFWTALYSDDETGDLWDTELIAYGIDYVDGQFPGHVAIKTPHPKSSTTIDDGDNNDDNGDDKPLTIGPARNNTDYEGDILINPAVVKSKLRD